MIEHDPDDIEKSLGQLVPKPASPGLRKRVLDSALEARKNVAMTPRMRAVAVVCSILIVAILGADSLLRRHESAQIAALLDGRSLDLKAGEEASDLAEVLDVQGSEASMMARLQVMAAFAVREDRERNFIEARKRLKGWLENETSEDFN